MGNREIKFRIWDAEAEEMSYDDGHFYITAHGEVIDVNDDLDITDKVILMQYTDLKDRNGEDIYEKDIIYDLDTDTKSVVKYDDSSAQYFLDLGIGSAFLVGELKVVGNVFEDGDPFEYDNEI